MWRTLSLFAWFHFGHCWMLTWNPAFIPGTFRYFNILNDSISHLLPLQSDKFQLHTFYAQLLMAFKWLSSECSKLLSMENETDLLSWWSPRRVDLLFYRKSVLTWNKFLGILIWWENINTRFSKSEHKLEHTNETAYTNCSLFPCEMLCSCFEISKALIYTWLFLSLVPFTMITISS